MKTLFYRFTLLCSLLLPVTLQAQFTYTTSNGAITITGPNTLSGSVVIPATINGLPVISIADYAFNNSANLTSITIPNSVSNIGMSAFYLSANLTTVTIGNSVTNIGAYAFQYCSSLAGIYFNGNSPTPNNDNTVFHSAGGAQVYYLSSTTGWGSTFDGLPTQRISAGAVTVTLSPNNIGATWALDSGTTNYASGATVTNLAGGHTIGFNAVNGYLAPANQMVTIMGSATNALAGSYVALFTYTTNSDGSLNLTGYDIYDGGTAMMIPATINGRAVTSIGNAAFYRYGLTSVTIPNSLTNIGAGNGVQSVFQDCHSLTNFTVAANNPAYSSTNGVLFDATQATLLQYPPGLSGSYTPPNGVTSIAQNAFYDCYGLTNITIPNSVTSIGGSAFGGCKNLNTVVISGNVISLASYAFKTCPSLMQIFFSGNAPTPANDTTVFSTGTSVSSKAVAYYLSQTTGWGATFDGLPTQPLPGAVTVTLSPNNISATWTLDGGTTAYASGATVTNLAGSHNIGFSAVNGYVTPANQTVTIASLGTNTLTGTYAALFTYTTNSDGSLNITGYNVSAGGNNVVIPPTIIGRSVTSIGYNAFVFASSLTNVVLPNTVTSLGAYVFYACSGLTSITLSNTVTSIGTGAFAACGHLTTINVAPNDPAYSSVNGVLYDEAQATLVAYPAGLTPGNYLIASGVTAIGPSAFVGCLGLTNVTLPNGVTTLGGLSFGNCSNLTQIYFNGNAPATTNDTTVFSQTGSGAKVYYLSQTTGWGAMFDGLPTQVVPGAVTVTLSPNNIGATWTLDGGTTAYASGTTVTNLSGSHTVGFNAVNGYVTPANQMVSLASLTTNVLTGTYVVASPFTYTTNSNGSLNITGSKTLSGNIVIPATIIGLPVTSIGVQAFQNDTTLTNVTITNNVTSIGSGAFAACTNLTTISVATNNSAYSSVNGVLFNKTRTGLLAYPAGLTGGSYVIPTSVTNLGSYAFAGCSRLTQIYFNSNAPTPANDSTVFQAVGSGAKVYYLSQTTGWGATFDGLPTQVMPGALTVTISPNNLGATWTLDVVTTAYASGVTVTNLSGNHTIHFSAVSRYATPTNQTVSIASLGTNVLSGVYVPLPPTISKIQIASGKPTIQFSGAANVSYSVQVSTNLTRWTTLLTTNAPTGGNFQFTDPKPPTPAGFYRLLGN